MPDPNYTFAYEGLPGVEDVSQAEIDNYVQNVEKAALPEIEAIQQAKASIPRAAPFP